jgi:hypothetical protein
MFSLFSTRSPSSPKDTQPIHHTITSPLFSQKQ